MDGKYSTMTISASGARRIEREMEEDTTFGNAWRTIEADARVMQQRLGALQDQKRLEILAQFSEAKFKRLMYGEWLADECEDCRTKEHVVRYVDTTGKEKGPIYLCRTCVEPQRRYRREWTPEDDKRNGGV